MNKEYDSQIAKIYDSLHTDKNYNKEVENIIEFFPSKVDKILDVGCGTGNHAIRLAEKGYNVVGLDPSKYMIDEANKKDLSNLKMHFEHKKIHQYHSDEKSQVVVSMFNVINHIVTLQELEKYIFGISMNLDEEGVFIFDCFNQIAMTMDKPKAKKNGNVIVNPKYNSMTSDLVIEYSGELEYRLVHKIWTPSLIIELLEKYRLNPIKILNFRNFEKAKNTDYKIMFVCVKQGRL